MILIEWLLDWWASILQRPAIKLGVAIVYAGRQGCGKNTWADLIGSYLGRHCKHLSCDQLLHNFNGDLMATSLNIVDETFMPGNVSKNLTGKLKSLFTDSKMVGATMHAVC